MTHDVRMMDDDQTPAPVEVAEPTSADDRREMKLDTEECTPEEAGYGYGV